MKKLNKSTNKKTTAKPSGRKKLAVKTLKNEKNKYLQKKINSFQETFFC